MDIDYVGGIFIPTSRLEQKEEPKMVGSLEDSYVLEEISKLNRNIDTIHYLMKDKEETIKWNQSKWYYKYYKKLIASKIFASALMCILLIILKTLTLDASILFWASSVGLLVPLTIIVDVVEIKKIIKENQTLSAEIDILLEIRNQITSQIRQIMQGSSSMEQSIQPSKTISSQLEIYKEARKILLDMQQEPSTEAIEQVKGVIEQIEAGKQKTIQRERLYSE